jgi:hypothetical protein
METIDGPVAEVPFYGGKIATDLIVRITMTQTDVPCFWYLTKVDPLQNSTLVQSFVLQS